MPWRPGSLDIFVGVRGVSHTQQPFAGGMALVEQALDSLELHALVLKLPDGAQASDVLRPVVADSKPTSGGGRSPRAACDRMLRTERSERWRKRKQGGTGQLSETFGARSARAL